MVEEVAFELALKDGRVAKGGKALSQRMQLIRDTKMGNYEVCDSRSDSFWMECGIHRGIEWT